MRLKASELTSAKYAELKNKIYKIYLMNIENPEDDKISRLYAELGKVAMRRKELPMFKERDEMMESVMEIVDDTLAFPYDNELIEKHKQNKTMSNHDFIRTAANLFGISTDLVESKLREYIFYNYEGLLEKNIIDKGLVEKLSKLYVEEEKKGNIKK